MTMKSFKLADGRHVKLGRIRPKAIIDNDRFRIIVLADGTQKVAPKLSYHYDHAKDVAPPPPAVLDYSVKAMAALQRMYLNDSLGCCVIAGKYHQTGLWTGNETGTPAQGTDAEVQNSYTTICGPGDNGCNITDVLDYFIKTGLQLSGRTHKIGGYVAVDWTSRMMLQVAIEVFGTVTFGVNLPKAWMDAADGGLWDVTTSPIIGGHDVPATGWTEVGVEISTWAGKRTITWAAMALKTWVEECYAELSPDWYSQGNLAPNGINNATLSADLQLLGQGQIPPNIGPTPPPVVPPPVPTPPPDDLPPVDLAIGQTWHGSIKGGQEQKFTFTVPGPAAGQTPVQESVKATAVPDGGPIPPPASTPLFSLNFSQAVPPGGLVKFQTKVRIPAGKLRCYEGSSGGSENDAETAEAGEDFRLPNSSSR